MNSKQCAKCNEIKPKSQFYKHAAFETLDSMIEFAQSLGFKSASYAIDKYGKEQFKNMYYENRQKSFV